MFYYKGTLAYNGTNYSGFQFQSPTDSTVQREVNLALKKVFCSNEIQVIAASRTDTNVHAQGQLVKMITPTQMEANRLKDRLNFTLPDDIRLYDLEVCDASFSVQANESKIYHYYFSSDEQNPLLSHMVYFHRRELDIDLMSQCAELFCGSHDFTGLYTQGGRGANPNRKILKCKIQKTSFALMSTEVYVLIIEASGFLKYMVRFIMGAMLEVGQKNICIDEIQKHLKDHHLVFKKAPAHGLSLHKILEES